MPELPAPKFKPAIASIRRTGQNLCTAATSYVPLQVTSNFTFLHGGSHPEELIARAAEAGCPAIALTDHHTLAGIVRAHVAAKAAGIPLIVGCRLTLPDDVDNVPFPGSAAGPVNLHSFTTTAPHAATLPPATTLLVYPTTRRAYGGLCRMLTRGKARAGKGQCQLFWTDLYEFQEEMLAVYIPPFPWHDAAAATLRRLRELFTNDRLSLGIMRLYGQNDAAFLRDTAALGRAARVPLAAVNDIVYHTARRQRLQDVLACIRHGCTVQEAGFRLLAHAERHVKTPEEMRALLPDYPQALARTLHLARRAGDFSLDQLKYQYPSEVSPPGTTPMRHLIDLTWRGAAQRYPAGVPASLHSRLQHEFALIEELNYPSYFLTVYDIVRFATGRHILCQGRGAAANSAVCYCLGITAVDPARIDLLMERFISRERDEPPDIDIDFEHERREEVIQYIYHRFGRDRAALTAEVISYRRRSALRDVGKALGLSLDCVDRLAKSGDWWDQDIMPEKVLRRLGLDPRQPALAHTIALAGELVGFPRHLSQHVGGFVITEDPLCELTPIEPAAMEDRTVIEWDKDDIDAMGMLKIDILALGMLTCIRKGLDLVNEFPGVGGRACDAPATGVPLCPADPSCDAGLPACPGPATRAVSAPFTLATVPPEMPEVYDMLCAADSLGVFQVESRAQMAMLPRMQPRTYYDLVIEVAIVRPGPIQGKMVHPYLRRRNGEEPVTYPDDKIKDILGRTLGVPLFQEQVMRLAMVAAGFTGGEADALRRSMAAWKRKENQLYLFGQKMFDGMTARGYSPVFAFRCFEQIKGFGEYGFPESHAASFALLVYVSAWLKCFHPAAFAAALLNSQPMGFYQPAQIIRDAQNHGVAVRPADVCASQWDCTLEKDAHGKAALRLGLRLIKGLPVMEAKKIVATMRQHGPISSLVTLWRKSGARVATLRTLAFADAFMGLGLTRQQALWAVRALHDAPAPLFENEVYSPKLAGGGDCASATRVDHAPNQDQENRTAKLLTPCVTHGTASGNPEPCATDLWASEPAVTLPAIPLSRTVAQDYAATGLSLKAHPMQFLRTSLAERGIMPISAMLAEEGATEALAHESTLTIAGLVLLRQRPATAKGVIFMTLEDETGTANLIVHPKVYQQHRNTLHGAPALIVHGALQRHGRVIHLLVQDAEQLRV